VPICLADANSRRRFLGFKVAINRSRVILVVSPEPLRLITMNFRLFNVIRVGLPLFLSATSGIAGVADDLVILHIEAIGGQAAVEALKAVRKDGYNEFGERRIPITIWGSVPDRIRIETHLNEDTTLIQGYDGIEAWQVRVRNGQVEEMTMTKDEHRQFINDAWFRGPLSDVGVRGVELKYGGVKTINESRCFLIEVTGERAKTCQVLIAGDTYQLTAKKAEQVIRGRSVPVLHQYSEFQPIAGVWLPHRIETIQDNHLSIVTVLHTITPNPALPPDIFKKPEIK
jgi:hypothetical protein